MQQIILIKHGKVSMKDPDFLFLVFNYVQEHFFYNYCITSL